MLLICWNVAGLSTTLSKIDNDYKTASIANTPDIPASRRSRSHAFTHYLRRHGDPDILCIQEHKIPLKQLSSRSEPFGCSLVDGYESFWSCCVDKAKKGFNGVVTYAKSGTVQSANSRPLGCDDLDDQGRVVMTDHKDFVVFNVYAPASCGMPLSYKMRFLNALHRAMTTQRSKGKKVLLVGDLNIAHEGIDEHFLSRSVNVNHIIQEYEGKNIDDLPQWKVDVGKHWDTIQSALDTLEAAPVTTTNVATGSSFEKYRARVTLGKPGSERKILLGSSEASASDCKSTFTFAKIEYYDEDLKETITARESNTIMLSTLAELMSKLARVEWDTPTLKLIAGSEGMKKTSPPCKWLSKLLNDDGMVDVFRHLFPNAEGRFTVWTQHTNRRYENDGARIDYTIIDSSLMDCIKTCDSPKLRCANFSKAADQFCSEEAAFHAAIASGLFQGASFQGGGIGQASDEALETQFGCAHTGIIYTAPQYSDHVAVSLLLNDNFDQYLSSSLSLNGKETKQAQPHKAQTKISSFFSSSNRSSSTSSNSSLSKRKSSHLPQKKSKKKPAGGTIMSHFVKKK